MTESDARNISRIIEFSCALAEMIAERDITPEEIRRDRFTQWAVTTPLYNIGEQVYQLSSELKQAHTEQPWNMVAGLRHRLVHDYDGINWSIIVEVLFQDMDPFVDGVKEILSGME